MRLSVNSVATNPASSFVSLLKRRGDPGHAGVRIYQIAKTVIPGDGGATNCAPVIGRNTRTVVSGVSCLWFWK